MINWPEPQLRHVTSRISDGTHGTFERRAEGRPLLSAKNIRDGRVQYDDSDSMISDEDYLSIARERRFEPGDVLVTIVGTLGRSAVLGTSDPLAFQRSVAALKPNGLVLTNYLRWVTESVRFQEELKTRANQSAQAGVYLQDLAEIPVPLPSLTEQRVIADYLDAETARIDALIAKKQQLIHLLEERWRVAAETTMNELGAAFGWTPLKRFIKCLDGRRVPLGGEERSLRQGEFPYYGASGVIDHVDDYLFDETLVLLGEDGAQLADPDYEISFVVSGPIWVNNHAHVLRPLGSDPRFLALHLSTLDRGSFISGATREKITQDDMSRIPVPNCPLDEQRRAAQRIRQVRADCDTLINRLQRQIGLLAEHRQALVAALVTGKAIAPTAA